MLSLVARRGAPLLLIRRSYKHLGPRGSYVRPRLPCIQAKLDHEDRTQQRLRSDEDLATNVVSDIQSWQNRLAKAADWFQDLSLQQKAWVVAAGVGFVIAAPRAVILVLIAAERLVVGSLLATEVLVSSLLLRGAVLVGGLAVLALVIWGLYAFVFADKKSAS